MKNLLLVVASQDYCGANHKGLWDEYSKLDDEYVTVVNLPADYFVSIVKRKVYRIREAQKGLIRVSDKLSVIRTLYFIRPEILPKFLYTWIAKSFWNQIEKRINLSDYSSIRLLVYNPMWVRILYNTKENVDICYYLYDEVRYYAHSQKINKKKWSLDEFACRNSNAILTMTEKLTESRTPYNNSIVTFGNGSKRVSTIDSSNIILDKTVAFIGNFRSWIDTDLLESIIQDRPNYLFVFAGTVENDMKPFFEKLLNSYKNTAYLGRFNKDQVTAVYQMVSCVIVPYLNNQFMMSTRPIKIVESIMAGCPVVTIPMSGYQECSFIKFASDKQQFKEAIDYMISRPIDMNSQEYIQFCEENSWEYKAKQLKEIFERIDE